MVINSSDNVNKEGLCFSLSIIHYSAVSLSQLGAGALECVQCLLWSERVRDPLGAMPTGVHRGAAALRLQPAVYGGAAGREEALRPRPLPPELEDGPLVAGKAPVGPSGP